MALKAKSTETNESSNDEDSKMKSYITKQFKKFMKNANVKGFDKDCKQSSSSQFKIQDRWKKDAKDGGQYTIPTEPKCFRCQGFGHMKQKCPTYLKLTGKSKALADTLSDTEPKTKSDNNDDEGILSAFTATVEPTEGIVEAVNEKEDLVESKFDEANQVIGALRFENNFLAERTKRLETELFQVRAQLERTSNVKLNEMLSFQKDASDKTSLRYDFSSPNIASSSTTVFVSPADNVNFENNESKIEIACENIDNGKFILGAPPKVEKKKTRNPRNKKENNKKS